MATATVLLTLPVLLSACGDDDSPVDPKPSASTSSAAPSQPEGKYGVTYDIVNWDEYADNDAVVAWKSINEATAGSFNRHRILPEMRAGYSKKVLRVYTAAFDKAWPKKLELPDHGNVRVDSAKLDGSAATLAVCLWAPTTDYQKNGKPFGDVPDAWRKQDVSMSQGADGWTITTLKEGDTCSGGAPT